MVSETARVIQSITSSNFSQQLNIYIYTHTFALLTLSNMCIYTVRDRDEGDEE